MDASTTADPADARDTLRLLNEEFYELSPAGYFRDRLHLLALRAVKPDGLAELMGTTLTWGGIRFVGDDVEDAQAAKEQTLASSRFVAIESQVLFHHAVEAVLRIFLGHEGLPACPWMEMAALRHFNKFRAKVDELAAPSWPAQRIEATELLIFGERLGPGAAQELIDARDSTIRIIQLLARRLNADSNLYNSAKHGLTVLGGQASIHFSLTAPSPELLEAVQAQETVAAPEVLLGSSGHTATFLETEIDEATKERVWYRTKRWVRPEQTAALTEMALSTLDSIWNIARWRYIGADHPGGIETLNDEAIDAVLQMAEGGPVNRFRIEVARELLQ